MTGSHWRDMFEQPRGASPASGVSPAPLPPRDDLDDIELASDPSIYRPWILQRGRTRPAMMLHLRRFEIRSGLWTGWAMPYPNLVALEYVGDRMLSLDFGLRQFVIQGAGLDQLVGPLQQGTVLAMHEHAPAVWGQAPAGPYISSIRRVGLEEQRINADA
ncbi:MAG: hypothetical protein ACOY45_04535 [Pseudomonadota bacterium]